MELVRNRVWDRSWQNALPPKDCIFSSQAEHFPGSRKGQVKLNRLEEKPQQFVLMHPMRSRSSSFSKKPEVILAWQFTMPETIFPVKSLTWTQTTLKIAGNHAATAASCLDVRQYAAWSQLVKEL